MATIYQKTVTDKTCILSPREYILRPFDFGTDWTEMRIGCYFSGIASSGDNTDSAVETVALSSASDRICFGIKDSATSDLPGFGAALFLGGTTATGSSSYCTGSLFGSLSGPGVFAAAGYHETTLVNGSSALTNTLEYPASASGATAYCGFYALKFVISNLGAASQSVAISATRTASVSGTDYSATALQLLMNNNTYQSPVSVAWNDGAIARTIPDAFYCRMPFYSNRIRLSAIRCIRYAP